MTDDTELSPAQDYGTDDLSASIADAFADQRSWSRLGPTARNWNAVVISPWMTFSPSSTMAGY